MQAREAQDNVEEIHGEQLLGRKLTTVDSQVRTGVSSAMHACGSFGGH